MYANQSNKVGTQRGEYYRICINRKIVTYKNKGSGKAACSNYKFLGGTAVGYTQQTSMICRWVLGYLEHASAELSGMHNKPRRPRKSLLVLPQRTGILFYEHGRTRVVAITLDVIVHFVNTLEHRHCSTSCNMTAKHFEMHPTCTDHMQNDGGQLRNGNEDI